MSLGTCKITRCDQPARWTVTSTGHPNGDFSGHYCRDHVGQKVPTWNDSPTPYTVTVSGPH